jgi:hypothetical protein
MHNILNIFCFGTTLYIFRTIFLSNIRSLRLYIQHQLYVIHVLWLLASGNEMELHSNSWWWTERPSETCTVLFQNKINLRYCASSWFYYSNILRYTVLEMSNLSWCSFFYRVITNYLYMSSFALRRMAFCKIMKYAGLYHKEFSFPLIRCQTVL